MIRLCLNNVRRCHSVQARPSLGFVCGSAACLTLTSVSAFAQQSLTSSLTGPAAIEARHVDPASLPYTVKSGDFRLLITPSLGLDWNDNVGISQKAAVDDFILRPLLQFNASYPVTANNILTLSLGVGYDLYLKHNEYSGPRVLSGSELSYDIYVRDFWINLHDHAKYTQDSAGEAAVANTGNYGGLDNLIGFSATWDLRDLVLTLGYDHENFIASSSEFSDLDRASELPSARAGFRLNPRLTVGLEGSVSFTAYDQHVLNDNTGYSGGLYGDWRPGSAFSVNARAGYAYYSFEQTSLHVRAVDQDSWYAGITLQHAITEALAYSLSAGHELRLGVQADSAEDTYVRPGITWRLTKDVSLQGSFSYEHGTQGAAGAGGLAETYDYFGAGFGFSRAITKKLTASLNYRLTLRSSDSTARGYAQDVVGLLLTYKLQ